MALPKKTATITNKEAQIKLDELLKEFPGTQLGSACTHDLLKEGGKLIIQLLTNLRAAQIIRKQESAKRIQENLKEKRQKQKAIKAAVATISSSNFTVEEQIDIVKQVPGLTTAVFQSLNI